MNNQIEKIKKVNSVLEKEAELEKDFYSSDGYLFPKDNIRYEDKLAQNKIRIKVLEWFDRIKTSEYSYKFSKYIEFYLDDMPRCGFELTDEIESEMYNKVWSSHSDLFANTNRKIRELIEYYCDVSDLEYMWTTLDNKHEYDIKDVDEYANAIISNFQEIINFLNSDTMRKLNVLIETYIDDMIKYAEEYDDFINF